MTSSMSRQRHAIRRSSRAVEASAVEDEYDNRIVKVTLTGGLIGLLTDNPQQALNRAIARDNADGWRAVQVFPDDSGNLIVWLSRLLLLLVTLLLYTQANGYFVLMERRRSRLTTMDDAPAEPEETPAMAEEAVSTGGRAPQPTGWSLRPGQKLVIVRDANIYVSAGQGHLGELLGNVPAGTGAVLTGGSGSWLRVKTNHGDEGYIAADDLEPAE